MSKAKKDKVDKELKAIKKDLKKINSRLKGRKGCFLKSILFFIIILALALAFVLKGGSFSIGMFGLGSGDDTVDHTNPNPDNGKNHKLSSIVEFDFMFKDDKIYHSGKKITLKKLVKFLTIARKLKETVSFSFDEETTSNGFFDEMKALAEKKGIKPTVRTIEIKK